MSKKSAYISYYYDYDYLNFCLNNIASLVDEIILCDGPFKYMIDDLNFLNIPLHMSHDQLNWLLIKYPNIKYYKGIFVDEFEKRKYAYNKCSNDIILMIDSDEMIDINEENFLEFELSDSDVGYVSFMNLCQMGYCFNNKGATKSVLFKKKNVSAEQHLDYTWLVGYENYRKPMTLKTKCYHNIETYHYSLMRTNESLIIKYLFYSNLWYENNKKENYFLKHLQTCNISIDQIKNIYTRTRIEGLGFPNHRRLNKRWLNNIKLNEQLKEIQKLITDIHIKEGDFILSDNDLFALIPKNKNSLIIVLDKPVNNFECTIYPMIEDETQDIETKYYESISSDRIHLELQSNTINCIQLKIKDQNSKINQIKKLI